MQVSLPDADGLPISTAGFDNGDGAFVQGLVLAGADGTAVEVVAGRIQTDAGPAPDPAWVTAAAWAARAAAPGQDSSLLLVDQKGGTDGRPVDNRDGDTPTDLIGTGLPVGTTWFDGVDAFAAKPSTLDTDPDDATTPYDGPWTPAIDLTDGWWAWVDCQAFGAPRNDTVPILQHVEMAQGVAGTADADSDEPDMLLADVLSDIAHGKIRASRFDTDSTNLNVDMGALDDSNSVVRHVIGWDMAPDGTTGWTDETWRRYPDGYEMPHQVNGRRTMTGDPKIKVGTHPLKLGYGRGFFFRAEVRKPDGSLLAQFDPAQFTYPTPTWTDGAGNEWTLPDGCILVPAGTDPGWVQSASSYFLITDSAANPGSGSWAIRARVRTDPGWWLSIGAPGVISGFAMGDLSEFDLGNAVAIQDGASGLTMRPSLSIPNNATVTLAVVVDRGTDEMRTYLNGTLLDTGDISAVGAVDTTEPFITNPRSGSYLLHELAFASGVPSADFLAA